MILFAQEALRRTRRRGSTDPRGQVTRPTTWPWVAACLLGGLVMGCGQSTDDDGMVQSTAPIVGGTVTYVAPQIGIISDGTNACTGTLVTPRYVVTAAHCFWFRTGPRDSYLSMFRIWSSQGVLLGRYAVDYAWVIDKYAGKTDIGIARLATPVPPSVATPVRFGPRPAPNDRVSVFGYGCTSRVDQTVDGKKRFFDYLYSTYYDPYQESTSVLCSGDSGGPRVLGYHDSFTTIWAINSASSGQFGHDVVADATRLGPMLLNAVLPFGDTAVTNSGSADFAAWAQAPRVRALAGDFNGDGRADVALVGGTGWSTIPIAFGDGAGSFWVTNTAVPGGFADSANMAESIVAGDFDGDGATDLALLNSYSWSTIPVAFSNRDGSFRTTNLVTQGIPTWAHGPGVYAVAGDFNGDGASDIALVGSSNWKGSTIPVGFSNRDGSFRTTEASVPSISDWSHVTGARALVGDFNGDGADDIALAGGSGWSTIPVAISNWAGAFSVTNGGVADFPAWAQTAGTKLVAGDFDGDGFADIAAVGGSYPALAGGDGSSSIAFALSDRRGGFSVGNLPLLDFPGWATAAPFALAGNIDGANGADLILVGGSGWSTIPVARLKPASASACVADADCPGSAAYCITTLPGLQYSCHGGRLNDPCDVPPSATQPRGQDCALNYTCTSAHLCKLIENQACTDSSQCGQNRGGYQLTCKAAGSPGGLGSPLTCSGGAAYCCD